MEAHRAIETAKNGLQRVRANDREHGNGHQSDRPQDGDLSEPEPRPETGRKLTRKSGRDPENRRDDQRPGGQHPTRSACLDAGQPPAKEISEHHAFVHARCAPADALGEYRQSCRGGGSDLNGKALMFTLEVPRWHLRGSRNWEKSSKTRRSRTLL